jgi:alpha-1,3-rhamnosyl/mannosyltransferase
LALRHSLARFPDRVKLSLATGRIRETDSLALWESWDELPRFELPLSTRDMLRYWRFMSWPPLTAWTGAADWIYAPAEFPVAKGKARLAVTSHDVAQDLKWQPPRRRQLLDKVFARADKVISVSHFNTRELLEAFPYLTSRVVTVHNAADDFFYEPATAEERASVRARLGLREGTPYLLSVANFQPRKNLERLIRAMGRLPEVVAGDVALVMIGEGGEDQVSKLAAAIQDLKAPKAKIILAGYLQGAALRAAYAEAVALVFPSLCESFGIPALEAMTQNCPVALADTTSLPEVGGDAGWYFDPTSEEAIAAAVADLMKNSELRSERVAAGAKIAAGFRWDNSAIKILDALEV